MASPDPDASPAPELPPVVVETTVPCPPARAFDYFTRDIAQWWPLESHSCGGEDAVDVRFEPRVGGSILETARDGTTHRWGTISAWASGKRVAFSWHPGRDESTAQWVEVAFVACGEGTHVTLIHGGFGKLGARALEMKGRYENGWRLVFDERYGGRLRLAVERESVGTRG